MNFEDVQQQIPDFARDLRINIETVLSEEGAPGLSAEQRFGVALACAYSLRDSELIDAIKSKAAGALNDLTVTAARSAAAIMGMNNVYYRSLHLMEDPALKSLPAKLRMTVIGKPGIEKVDFELMSLGVSALAGCGQCLSAHAQEVRTRGVSDLGVQSVLRIAAVLNGAYQALGIRQL